MELPERFREGSDDEHDVCAPQHGVALNQSIFGLIAAAGSAAGLEEIPSDSDEEDHAKTPMSQTVPALAPTPAVGGVGGTSHEQPSRHSRRSSKALLAKSLHKLRLKPIRERKSSAGGEDMMSSSQILTPRKQEQEPEEDTDDTMLSNAPVLSRILSAEAQMRKELGAGHRHEERPQSPAKRPASLADQVQKMFKFHEKQDIIAEYRCHLVQNIDVPGHIFVTKRYICFYAYLPQMTAKVVKSGYISKRGMHDPRYHRYYCELKGHVLSFYEDPAQINYPRSLVDMRRCIGVFAIGKEKGKDETHFTLETDKREYQLKADSAESANDWIKVLQQEILNTHNDGGLIKITLPIENILDIDDNYIRGIAFSESLRIRVIDNDETYAVDEVSGISLPTERARALTRQAVLLHG
jgi:sterol 3beta-glucosyltransferase